MVPFRNNGGSQTPILAKDNLGPCLSAASRLNQTLPLIALGVVKQQDLQVAASLRLDTEETGRNNPGLIDHQGIAWIEKINNLIKVQILLLACLAV